MNQHPKRHFRSCWEDLEVGVRVCFSVCCWLQPAVELKQCCDNLGHYTDCYAEKKA